MKEPVYVAVDIGATGIKMAAASFDGKKITIRDMISAASTPCLVDGHEKVDIPYILETIKYGLDQFSRDYQCISLGIDTFGNGYGLIDEQGNLLELPHFYRDRRIDGVMEHVHKHFSDWEMYERMGNVPIKTRSLFHLYQDVLEDSESLKKAKYFLPLSNLLEYLITGEMGCERTIASVLYYLDKDGKDWNFPVLMELGIPTEMFGSLSDPGVLRGNVSGAFAQGSDWEGIPVICVAGHDTESALAAIPGLDETKAFVSMGTSFIFGARVAKPVVNKDSFRERFKNMYGVFGSYSLCKDVPGFWILERCMEKWREQIPDIDYAMICGFVETYQDNETYLDISDDRFRVSESNILETIEAYCEETGQKTVSNIAEVARCLFESYALYIKWSLEKLSSITKVVYRELDVMNGGVKNPVLLQMIADAAGIPVLAASSLASVNGNLLMQIYTADKISSKEEFDQVIYDSVMPVIYESNLSSCWDVKLQYMKDKGLFKEV